MALSECLRPYKVKDLSLPQLVTLEHPRHRLFDAISLLSEHHLLSAPVLDAEGMLLGMLDALDIVAEVVQANAEGKGQLLNKHIDSVMGKVSASHVVHLDDGLAEVVGIIARARRVVVLGKEGKPESIITQSTVIQFLHAKGIFEARRHRWLAKELCTTDAFVINEDETVLKAFQKLLEKRVASLVILDEDGHALTVISASDLVRTLGRMEDMSAALSILEANVVQFVAKTRSNHTQAAVISVPPEAPLTAVVEKLAKARVHRLVIMGEDRTPLGVLSLSDICRAVAAKSEEVYGGA